MLYILLAFPKKNAESRGLCEDLKRHGFNVTDSGTVIYAHKHNITANQIVNVLSICDKYGSYSVEELRLENK